jgi:hypothetical protein
MPAPTPDLSPASAATAGCTPYLVAVPDTAGIPDGVCDGARGGVNGAGLQAAGPLAPRGFLAGFAEGHALDVLAPGAVLARSAEGACVGGLEVLSDDELIGLIRAWRRLASWAVAGEHAAVAELLGRRERDAAAHPGGLGCQPVDYVADELACALTLTRRSAENLAGRAAWLSDLPSTAAALRCGQIDVPKALTIIDGVAGIAEDVALAVEDKVLPTAPRQTTGELRAAVRRAVFAADPAAASRQRENAEKSARVELWDEPAGTKALAGRDLPPAEVLAADKHIAAIASELKNRGAGGTLELLRAKVYLALLAGQPLDHLCAPAATSDQHGPAGMSGATCTGDTGHSAAQDATSAADDTPWRDGVDGGDPGAEGASRARQASSHSGFARRTGNTAARPAGSAPGDLARLAGWINLTVPLTTLLDLAEAPGDAAGFGPLDASAARVLTGAAASDPATRWCLTVTDDHDRVIGHGCHPRQRAGPPTGSPPTGSLPSGDPPTGGPATGGAARRAKPPGLIAGHHAGLVIKFDPVAFASCDHRLETGAYKPSPRLRHLIEIRDRCCCFPGCRRPAAKCDLDHTIPYDQGGCTCQCNLAPLCRTHHQLKQTHGWRLRQPAPGVFEWTTPSGRKYIIRS